MRTRSKILLAVAILVAGLLLATAASPAMAHDRYGFRPRLWVEEVVVSCTAEVTNRQLEPGYADFVWKVNTRTAARRLDGIYVNQRNPENNMALMLYGKRHTPDGSAMTVWEKKIEAYSYQGGDYWLNLVGKEELVDWAEVTSIPSRYFRVDSRVPHDGPGETCVPELLEA